MPDETKKQTVTFAKPHRVVSHLGAVQYQPGDTATLDDGHAADLAKLGIVKAGPSTSSGQIDPKKN